MSQMYCTYCGKPCDFWCRDCGENHLMTAQEFKEYNGDWPDDGEDHDEQEESK